MTYYGAKELAESFRTVRQNTIQIAQDIPEDKYGFKAADDGRPRRSGTALVHTLVCLPEGIGVIPDRGRRCAVRVPR